MRNCCLTRGNFNLKKIPSKYCSSLLEGEDSYNINQDHDHYVNTLLSVSQKQQLCNIPVEQNRRYPNFPNARNSCLIVGNTTNYYSTISDRLRLGKFAQFQSHILNHTNSSRSYQPIRLLSTIMNNNMDIKFTSDTDEPNEEERKLREKYTPREISFKTAFGQLACLEWGLRDAPRKVFCMHGWLDNAGSFERLIPYILNYKNNHELYHFVAMDMPGVGLSSHRPHGADYTTFSNIIEMRRVTTQLGWHQNLTLLAHSLGAHFSFLYSCIYPKQVKSVISIDVARPITFHADNWNITIGNAIENYFKNEYQHCEDPQTQSVIPVYTESEALKRLMEAHSNSLSYESARTMMKRGARKTSTGYIFNRDIRHRGLSVEFRPDEDLMLKYLDRAFGANLFVIRSTRSPFRMPEEMRQKYYGIYGRNCKLFREKVTDGTHHVHMNNPDVCAAEINQFLEEVEQLVDCKPGSISNSNQVQAGMDSTSERAPSGEGVKLEGSAEAPRPKSKL